MRPAPQFWDTNVVVATHIFSSLGAVREPQLFPFGFFWGEEMG
jgi:hypothetical protein